MNRRFCWGLLFATTLTGCNRACEEKHPESAPQIQKQTKTHDGDSASTSTTPNGIEGATPQRPFRPTEHPEESRANPPAKKPHGPLDLSTLELPPGFVIDLYTDGVPGARTLRRGGPGILYVGTRQKGVVYAVVDRDANHQPEEVSVVARGLESPNGLAYRDGTLFIAEIGRIVRLEKIDQRVHEAPTPQVVTEALPEERHHGWRYMDFGPDGLLYVGVGAPCNVCKREEPLFASIATTRISETFEASPFEIFARGIRNTVGFAWHPETKELWFTENGRDLLGDDLPPDELNRAPQKGMHFGFPGCHAGVVADPKFFQEQSCVDSVPPVRNLGAHVAALGMEFTIGKGWPKAHARSVLIAEHGSWNRSKKVGYRISEVALDEKDRPATYRSFVEGWLRPGEDEVSGRPVDLEFLDDGSLLISDDFRGAIYRVSPSR